jgi:hypothetical protein
MSLLFNISSKSLTDYSKQQYIHGKCFDHKNYGDWKLRGPCRENLHYLWKRAVRIAGKPRDNYRTCSVLSRRISFQILWWNCKQKRLSENYSFVMNACIILSIKIHKSIFSSNWIKSCKGDDLLLKFRILCCSVKFQG